MLGVVLAFGWALQPLAGFQVTDRFGRDLTSRGLELLDWEGHIANPAVRLTITPPPSGPFPLDVSLHGTGARLVFCRADATDVYGAGRRLRFERPGQLEVWVSLAPDRDNQDDPCELWVQGFGAGREAARTVVPVRGLDQDRNRPSDFPVTVNFSEDRTGFFGDRAKRDVVREAVEDWAYFLDGRDLATVPPGAEQIPIWLPDGFRETRLVKNPAGYRGFYVWVTGLKHDPLRAGGAPNPNGGWQRARDGRELPLRRSGQLNFEVRGNYNTLGWRASLADEDWWVSGLRRNEPHDLYSIAMHEFGHALAFDRWTPGVQNHVRDFGSARLRGYVGRPLAMDASFHFPGVTDPASGFGAFGAEYEGRMKTLRWWITKFSILALESAGYRLRDLSWLRPLSATGTWRDGIWSPKVVGGVPGYRWTVVSGEATVDPWSGQVAGPVRGRLRLRVEDQFGETAEVDVSKSSLGGG